jgi:hypothetical protein
MEQTRSALLSALALALLATFCIPPAQAANDKGKSAHKSAHKSSRKAAPKSVEAAPEPASPAQIEASEKVYLGAYACEFNQTVEIAGDSTHRGYITVKHGKTHYLMRPVLSPTGAIRLEDVRGEGLIVQIASKSMLLNVKTGQRVVDNCVCPEQRALMKAARVAKASQSAATSASVAALLLPVAGAASAPKR